MSVSMPLLMERVGGERYDPSVHRADGVLIDPLAITIALIIITVASLATGVGSNATLFLIGGCAGFALSGSV